MPTALGTLGMNAANAAAGGMLGMVFGGINDRRQLNQQKKLQNLEIAGQKHMTEYNMQKQIEMWEKTSYPAQLAMMKKAGLSPGLMYGGGGGGGQTANIETGKVSGGQATQGGGGEMMGMAQMTLQNQLLQAQKENIEADTKNKLGDAANKPLVGKNLEASTNSLTQGITNMKTANELQELEKQLQTVNVYIAEESQEAQLKRISQENSIRQKQIEILENDQTISDATVAEKITIIEQDAIGSLLRNEATRAGIKLTEEQTKAITEGISQKWTEIGQRDTQLAIELFKAEVSANNPNIGQVLGRLADDTIESVFKLGAGGRPKWKSMKSYNKKEK